MPFIIRSIPKAKKTEAEATRSPSCYLLAANRMELIERSLMMEYMSAPVELAPTDCFGIYFQPLLIPALILLIFPPFCEHPVRFVPM